VHYKISVDFTTKIFLYTADIATKRLYLVYTKGFYTRFLTSAGFYQEVIIPALFTTEAFTVKILAETLIFFVPEAPGENSVIGLL